MADLWSLWHPEAYHGWAHRGRSFEGWYFKLIDARETKHDRPIIEYRRRRQALLDGANPDEAR